MPATIPTFSGPPLGALKTKSRPRLGVKFASIAEQYPGVVEGIQLVTAIKDEYLLVRARNPFSIVAASIGSPFLNASSELS